MAEPKKDSQPEKTAANTAAEKLDADIIVLNSELWPPTDIRLVRVIAGRKVRPNVVLILVTEGGSSDSAFRIMRAIQGKYKRVTVVVPGRHAHVRGRTRTSNG
jgi:ClpP class serine protease